jgi:hypothetical protein
MAYEYRIKDQHGVDFIRHRSGFYQSRQFHSNRRGCQYTMLIKLKYHIHEIRFTNKKCTISTPQPDNR